jgi:hypothetical protein
LAWGGSLAQSEEAISPFSPQNHIINQEQESIVVASTLETETHINHQFSAVEAHLPRRRD